MKTLKMIVMLVIISLLGACAHYERGSIDEMPSADAEDAVMVFCKKNAWGETTDIVVYTIKDGIPVRSGTNDVTSTYKKGDEFHHFSSPAEATYYYNRSRGYHYGYSSHRVKHSRYH